MSMIISELEYDELMAYKGKNKALEDKNKMLNECLNWHRGGDCPLCGFTAEEMLDEFEKAGELG